MHITFVHPTRGFTVTRPLKSEAKGHIAKTIRQHIQRVGKDFQQHVNSVPQATGRPFASCEALVALKEGMIRP